MNKREKEVIQKQLAQEKQALQQLERQYVAALSTVNSQIAMLQSMEQTPSRRNRLAYQKQVKEQIEAALDKLRSETYQTIEQYMNDSYTTGYVGTMYNLHGQKVPVVTPIDKNAVVKAVTTDTKLKHGVYNTLGMDMAKLKKTISNELTRGVTTGMAYDDIARNIKMATGAPLGRAKTIVRTEGHRIQQASQEDARQVAKSKGADVVKQWDATLDSATRDSHRRLDGQIREVDEPFEINGLSAMYPGEFGDPAEDCNCRCVALTRARAALDADELKTMQERAAFFKLDKSKSFDDFKEKYLKVAERETQNKTPVRIETRQQAVEAIENSGFTIVEDGLKYLPDEQVVVLATRLQELEARFGCAKDGEYYVESYVFKGKAKNQYAHVRYGGKYSPPVLVLNAQEYFVDVQTLAKRKGKEVASGWSTPCAEEHLKDYTVTHEYGHMLSAMIFKKRTGVSVLGQPLEVRKKAQKEYAAFEKIIWKEIRDIAKEKNPDFHVTEKTLSRYGMTNHSEAFAETFANAMCGKPNALGEAMNIWLERNGF